MGVGKGNGEGSIPTRFQEGAPSANPKGRPRKRASHLSPAEQIGEAMMKMVDVRIGNKKMKMRQFSAMIECLLNDYPTASLHSKLQLLKYLRETVPDFMHQRPPEDNGEAIIALVEVLAERARNRNN